MMLSRMNVSGFGVFLSLAMFGETAYGSAPASAIPSVVSSAQSQGWALTLTVLLVVISGLFIVGTRSMKKTD